MLLTHRYEVSPMVPLQVYQITSCVLHYAQRMQQRCTSTTSCVPAVVWSVEPLNFNQIVTKLVHQIQIDADQISRLINGGNFGDLDEPDAILFFDVEEVALHVGNEEFRVQILRHVTSYNLVGGSCLRSSLVANIH